MERERKEKEEGNEETEFGLKKREEGGGRKEGKEVEERSINKESE